MTKKSERTASCPWTAPTIGAESDQHVKFAVGLQIEGRKMGGTRGPVRLWSEGLRVTCEVASSSSDMADIGAHHTVDA